MSQMSSNLEKVNYNMHTLTLEAAAFFGRHQHFYYDQEILGDITKHIKNTYKCNRSLDQIWDL
jgi:hypothetical protein